MALPEGVITAIGTVGVPVSFSGIGLRSIVSIEPSVPLVHTATGTPLVNMVESIATANGAAGQFTLPVVNQDGFQDEAGNPYKNWYYIMTFQYGTDRSMFPAKTKVFQLLMGQTIVDLDLLPSGAPAMPYTAPVARVTDVNGKTNSVSVVEATAENVAAALPARLSAENIAAGLDPKLDDSEKGAASGVAPLGTDARVPDANLPVRLGDAALNATYAAIKKLRAFEFVPTWVYGDSYGNWPASADAGTQFCDRVVSRLRMKTPTNYAIGGTRMDQIATQLWNTWTVNQRGLVFLADAVLNDVQQLTTAQTATTAEAFRSFWARTNAWALLGYGSSAFVYGPNWTSGTSSTVGSYVDAAFNGDAAYLALPFVTGAGFTLAATDTTGATIKTITTGGYGQAFTGVVKLSGFGAGAHSVRLTVTAGSATITGLIVPSPTPPKGVWYKPGPVLSFTSAQNTAIGTFIAACEAVRTADFPNVLPIAAGSGWDPSTMLTSDNIHLNSKGNSYVADLIENALIDTPFQQGLNWQTTTNAGAYTSPAVAYTSPGAAAPAAPTLTATAANQVALSWTLPTDGGATITSWALQYKLSTDSTWTTHTPAPGASSRSLNIPTGLTPSTSYDFRIAAVNSVGIGTYSAVQTVTVGVVLVGIRDNFDRADSATTLGVASQGGTWASITGTWGIAGNKAYSVTGANNDIALLDSTLTDQHVSAVITGSVNGGLIARSNSAGTSYYLTNSTTVYKCIGGAFTSLGALSTPYVVGDTIELDVIGSEITVKRNGAAVFTGTDTAITTGTYAGFRINAAASTAVRFDDLIVN